MKEPRTRHLGELAFDLAIVIGSALYVHAAQSYPPQGRQIPRLVGLIALAMGALHLVAHAVPRLWAVTHDNGAAGPKEAEPPAQAVPAQAGAARREATATMTAAEAVRTESADVPSGAATSAAQDEAAGGPAPAASGVAAAPTSLQMPSGDPRQVVLAMAWTFGLLVVVYLFGFDVAIPLFFLVYFGVMRAWRTALISAVAMWAVSYGLFEYALAVPLPHGVL